MSEVWKPVHGWPLYEASSAGRVRRARTTAHGGAQVGRILRIFWHPSGYGFVTLSQGTASSRITLGVHKVVALAFLGSCPPKHEVNHRDLDKRNNQPTNLEYQTHAENMEHAKRLGCCDWRTKGVGRWKNRYVSC